MSQFEPPLFPSMRAMSAPTTPGITVVIPTYNRAQLVTRAINSVLAQSMPDFELIVVDDGSSDETADVLAALKDPRLRVIHQENRGVSAARNVGIDAAVGEMIVWLDSDDEAEPGWLEFFERSRKAAAGLASCAALMIRTHDGVQVVRTPESGGPVFGHLTARFLAGAMAVERKLLREVGGFKEGLKFGEHTELGVRLGARARRVPFEVCTTDVPLVRSYRSDAPVDPRVRLDSALALLESCRQNAPRSRSYSATYLAIAGVSASRIGERRQAIRLLGAAVVQRPDRLVNWARLARAAVARGLRS